jgi:hypothetical protein
MVPPAAAAPPVLVRLLSLADAPPTTAAPPEFALPPVLAALPILLLPPDVGVELLLAPLQLKTNATGIEASQYDAVQWPKDRADSLNIYCVSN